MNNLSFFPWMRLGLGEFIDFPDGNNKRAVVKVKLGLEEEPARPGVTLPDADVAIDVIGPGDISALDSRVVTRVWPKPDVTNVETTFFPLIEFSEPDLPWRYTPEPFIPADASDDIVDTLPPWLVLITLTDDEWEVVKSENAADAKALPAIKILERTALPDLENSFAWAHLQVSGTVGSQSDLPSILASSRERVTSRIFCPRRLKANQPHTAFLVPAYSSGVAAGLGLPPGNFDPLVRAWHANLPVVVLPVYYQWRFHTGEAGSFRELARRLVPRVLSGAAHRQMDIADPGFGLERDPSRTPVSVEGALRPVGANIPEWDPDDRAAFAAEIRDELNAPADGLTTATTEPPALSPPLYGEWHAATHKVQVAGAPPWFDGLNLAPHLRVVAALGTQVVQKDQQALMTSAWNQVDGLPTANQHLREAQLGREGSFRLFTRHIKTIPRFEQVFQLAEKVLARVIDQPGTGGAQKTTVRSALEGSPVPTDILTGAWRRLGSVRGFVGRRQGRTGEPPAPGKTLIEETNDGGKSPAPPPSLPEGVPTPGRAGGAFAPGCLTPDRLNQLGQVPQVDLLFWALVFLFVGRSMAAGSSPFWISRTLLRLSLALIRAGATVGGLDKLRDEVATATGTTRPGDVPSAPTVKDFHPEEPVPPNAPSIPPPPLPGPGDTDNTELTNFRDAAKALLEELEKAPAPGRGEFQVDLSDLAGKVLTSLDPRTNLNPIGQSKITVSSDLWNPADPLEPVMVTPQFPQPMYEALREISLDWVLPGLGEVPIDTVALLETNQEFVEAFMAGLNHEMSRELLWREYPTDQRGTYFRQFWDIRGFIPKGGGEPDPATQKDILPMIEWTGALGENSARDPRELLVLFLRGEIVRRFPHMIVYSATAGLETPPPPAPPKRTVTDDHEHPLFSGNLGSDATFYGFGSSRAEMEEGAQQQGTYFVLQEPPHDTRFTWEIPPPAVPIREGEYLTFDVAAAEAASTTLSRPARVAFYVTAMLPPQAP